MPAGNPPLTARTKRPARRGLGPEMGASRLRISHCLCPLYQHRLPDQSRSTILGKSHAVCSSSLDFRPRLRPRLSRLRPRRIRRQLRRHLLFADTGATGWSYSWSSRRQAEREAQQNCYENAGDCRVAIWFKNACGAVAAGDDGGWGSGWGSNSNRARREAIKQCSQYSDGCRVVRWQCSGAR